MQNIAKHNLKTKNHDSSKSIKTMQNNEEHHLAIYNKYCQKNLPNIAKHHLTI